MIVINYNLLTFLAVAVYYVLKPENFVVKEMNVKIITDSKEKYG